MEGFLNVFFFDDYNGVILIKEVFINMFKYLFLILNLNDSKYCGYFFRIGIVIFVVMVSIE